MKLRGLVPNFYINVSCFTLPILLQKNRWTNGGNILIAHRYINVEIPTEAAKFDFCEHIHRIFFAVRTFTFEYWMGRASGVKLSVTEDFPYTESQRSAPRWLSVLTPLYLY
jgi:hypothetical protein